MMELLRHELYPEDTPEHRAQRQRALDWMPAACADDLTIVANYLKILNNGCYLYFNHVLET